MFQTLFLGEKRLHAAPERPPQASPAPGPPLSSVASAPSSPQQAPSGSGQGWAARSAHHSAPSRRAPGRPAAHRRAFSVRPRGGCDRSPCPHCRLRTRREAQGDGLGAALTAVPCDLRPIGTGSLQTQSREVQGHDSPPHSPTSPPLSCTVSPRPPPGGERSLYGMTGAQHGVRHTQTLRSVALWW